MPSLQRRFKKYTAEERLEYVKRKYLNSGSAPLPKKSSSKNCAAIGNEIKRLRMESGMSQRELGMRLNTYQCSVSRIEAGKANLGIVNLEKIAKVFNKKIKIILH